MTFGYLRRWRLLSGAPIQLTIFSETRLSQKCFSYTFFTTAWRSLSHLRQLREVCHTEQKKKKEKMPSQTRVPVPQCTGETHRPCQIACTSRAPEVLRQQTWPRLSTVNKTRDCLPACWCRSYAEIHLAHKRMTWQSRKRWLTLYVWMH